VSTGFVEKVMRMAGECMRHKEKKYAIKKKTGKYD